jgi:hypothetical protein
MGSLAWRRIWPTTVLLCACAAAGRSCVNVLYHYIVMMNLHNLHASAFLLVSFKVYFVVLICSLNHGHIVQLVEHPICIWEVQVSITCMSNFCFLFCSVDRRRIHCTLDLILDC